MVYKNNREVIRSMGGVAGGKERYCDEFCSVKIPEEYSIDKAWDGSNLARRRERFPYIDASEDELLLRMADVVNFYQPILGLEGWDITIQLLRKKDMSGDNNAADVAYVKRNKCAVISILSPVDRDNWVLDSDLEADILHELLHLVLCEWEGRDSRETDALEYSILALSRAMLTLKREFMPSGKRGDDGN